MIDLSCTRAAMLDEIGVPAGQSDPLADLADPRVASSDVHVRARGRGRTDLFPHLRLALWERFMNVPRPILIRDLFQPLKNALGNAQKHGNGGSPAKSVTVDLFLTRKGALIAITDEGEGFDAGLIFRRFQDRETYYEHHGAGLRNLHAAASRVTYENGGRTVLLCFRPPSNASRRPPFPFAGDGGSRRVGSRVDRRVAGGDASRSGDAAILRVAEPGWIRRWLAEEMIGLSGGRPVVESCRIYLPHAPGGDDCGNRYLVRLGGGGAVPGEERVLTGRLHASPSTAAADFGAAASLFGAMGSRRLRIPRPVAWPTREPRLVLYDFDPWMNLREYLAYRESLKAIRRSARRAGHALAALHRSRLPLRVLEPIHASVRLRARAISAERALAALPSGAALIRRLRRVVRRSERRTITWRRRPQTPIHGAPRWDRIHYGVDGRFYLYRFESCRQDDPGLDLGVFAMDLLRFSLARGDEKAFDTGCDELLDAYNSEAVHPMRRRDLHPFIVLALLDRLRRTRLRSRAEAEHLLEALRVAGEIPARSLAGTPGLAGD